MEPFSIECPTCQTRLRVRHEEALGQILACPRCGSMVQVESRAHAPTDGPADGAADELATNAVLASPNDSGLDLSADGEPRNRRWLLVGAVMVIALVAGLIALVVKRGEPSSATADAANAQQPPGDANAGEEEPTVADAAPGDENTSPPTAEPTTVVSEAPSDARAVDEANHLRIVNALSDLAEEEGAFPVGAAGAVQLPPDNRLSWIATLLPYCDHADWHAGLNFRRSWNDPQNRDITTRRLDAVINPGLGADATAAPSVDGEPVYPPTHYVGVAGVGADAGSLPADHPRAGMFGYSRAIAPADVKDGLSNTIAVLGASQELGPWSAGGRATVRPLTQTPYINGPDGFGSGTPDGLLAGMADGSARFLSNDIDPRVMEQMATIAGGEPPAGPTVADAASGAPAEAPAADSDSAPSKPAPSGDTVAAAPDTTGTSEAAPGSTPPEGDEESRAAVEARLGERLVEIDFANVSLDDFVEFVSQLSALRITLDLEALAEIGVTPDLKFSIKQSETTIGQALQAALAELGIVYSIRDGQLIVTSPRRLAGELRQVRYRVGDLLGRSHERLTALAELVEAVVEPASWHTQGGQGVIQLVEDSLVVRQNDAAQFQILVLCEKLRVARGQRPASSGDPSRFQLTSRTEQARALLDKPVKANFSAPTRLAKILDYVERQGGASFQVDWPALAAQGLSREIDATLIANQLPLADALAQMLALLQLDYRVVGPQTLLITTREAAVAHRELEFYPVRDLMDEATTPLELLTRLSTSLHPAAGAADGARPATLRFDEPSACVLVHAPQEVQRQVEELLAAWRSERAAGAEPADGPNAKPTDEPPNTR